VGNQRRTKINLELNSEATIDESLTSPCPSRRSVDMSKIEVSLMAVSKGLLEKRQRCRLCQVVDALITVTLAQFGFV
jgi:hypothetical protein